ILSGERSRTKRIEIRGVTRQQILALLVQDARGVAVESCPSDEAKSPMSADIQEIQGDLRAARIDGWLFYDVRGRDPIAQHILSLPDGMRTRRWFYFVPAKGTPKKLVHKIETQSLASLPGETLYYSAQEELRKNLKKMFGRAKNVAMQYSPKNAIP